MSCICRQLRWLPVLVSSHIVGNRMDEERRVEVEEGILPALDINDMEQGEAGHVS